MTTFTQETAPEPGTVWMQSIAEILEKWDSTDGAKAGEWDWLLDEKRSDDHYDDVVESVSARGFVRPVTCWLNYYGTGMTYGDGHHRLAAAIDLGMEEIPVEFRAGFRVAGDSGGWDSSCDIPESNDD